MPERGIYDNMKTAVDKLGPGKQRVIKRRFHPTAGHYLFEAEFCNPAAGWERGQVEKGVRDARQPLCQDAQSTALMVSPGQGFEFMSRNQFE